jgi:hypothetical protein
MLCLSQITTIVFVAFTVRPDEIEARSSIVLTVLLTVVAFNYVCQDKLPNGQSSK